MSSQENKILIKIGNHFEANASGSIAVVVVLIVVVMLLGAGFSFI